jgi:hypothetical protein
MGRSLNAPLSPNEEVALRRVALGLAPKEVLPLQAITRLKYLVLIEDSETGLRLTDVGRRRHAALPGVTRAECSSAQEQFASFLSTYVKEAKN